MINETNLDSSIYTEMRTMILSIDFSPNSVTILSALDTKKSYPQIIITPAEISSKDFLVGGGQTYSPSIGIHVFDKPKQNMRFDTISGLLLHNLRNMDSDYFKTGVNVASQKISPELHNQKVHECDIVVSASDNL